MGLLGGSGGGLRAHRPFGGGRGWGGGPLPVALFGEGFALGGSGQYQKQHFSNTFRNVQIVQISAAFFRLPVSPKGVNVAKRS